MKARGWIASLVALAVVGVAVVVGLVVSQRWPTEAGVDDVARLVPVSAAAVDVTDWTALRSRLDVGDDALLNEASDRDLSTRSTLVSSGEVVGEQLGWSPGTVRWEAFVQTTGGTALLIGLPQSRERTEARMREVGYVESGDRWTIDLTDLRAGGVSTPELFQHVQLLDGGVAVASAEQPVVGLVADAAQGRSRSLADDPTVAPVLARATELEVFGLQDASAGCASTDPAQIGPDIAAQAEVAVDAAGTLRPYRWLLRGLATGSEGDPDRFVVVMGFDSGTQGAEQAEVRARLATGPFIGQTGTVEDSIRLVDHGVEGDLAVLDLERQDRAVSLMSFVGPLLLASC